MVCNSLNAYTQPCYAPDPTPLDVVDPAPLDGDSKTTVSLKNKHAEQSVPVVILRVACTLNIFSTYFDQTCWRYSRLFRNLMKQVVAIYSILIHFHVKVRIYYSTLV